MRRRDRAVQIVTDALGGSVFDRRIAVLGAAFKPHSDDVRDSPALDVATRLHGLGARVTVTDPQAIDNARRISPQLTYVRDRDEALQGAEVLLLVTEWASTGDSLRRRTRRLSWPGGSSSTDGNAGTRRSGARRGTPTTGWGAHRGRGRLSPIS
ncbi:UDP binding domain-containing protein [Microbacterium sp. NPDC057659]|uniref:UDP binding domain-containing protein n=1 Tax=Microbacterium sp. NPDC057659 TaxID=3346198 RepID=UPI00366CC915